MSQLLLGSVCFTDLMEQAKAGHSAFSRSKNGKVYFNFVQFMDAGKPDRYGNTSVFKLNSKKEKRDSEGDIVFGRAKFFEKKTEEKQNYSSPTTDDLPF